MVDVAAIFKAYDVRGVVPDELDEAVARATGAAFVEVLDVLAGPGAVVIGYDMRPSSPGLAAAFAEGVTSTGADVIDIGLASTDQLYFASGRLQLPGAMFTASHNPAQYNGIKMCRAGASPVGAESGLRDIADLVAKTLIDGLVAGRRAGQVRSKDLLTAYADHLQRPGRPERHPPAQGRRRRRQRDGRAHRAGRVRDRSGRDRADVLRAGRQLPEPRGEPARPEEPGRPAGARCVEVGADLGLAFDGDADRCFVVDEKGDPISPSAITGAVAVRELAKHPGSAVIHNLITSKAVPELITEHGGTPVRARVGHSYIKQKMAETDAVFGGEHSAHYYFRDFWRADTGMLAALHVLAALGEQDKPASELFSVYERYVASGEINSRVDDAAATVAAIEDTYGDREGITVDHLDGLTVDAGQWWFNVRASNTEPLLRLNVEAGDAATMERVRDEVLALITGAPEEEEN